MITTDEQKSRVLQKIESLERRLRAICPVNAPEASENAEIVQLREDIASLQVTLILYEAASAIDQVQMPQLGVVTSAHVRAGLKWFLGNFTSAVQLSNKEAATLMNVTSEDLKRFRGMLDTHESFDVSLDIIARLSVLLGIYRSIASVAPNNPSQFIYIAFRNAPQPFYDGHTLIEFLIRSQSLDRWSAVRAQLESLEAKFIGY